MNATTVFRKESTGVRYVARLVSSFIVLAVVCGFSAVHAQSVASGLAHSLFLKEDGTVWASGDNAYGQLGDGTTVDRSTPVQIPGLTGITAVAAGDYHSLFLKSDGTVWACGYNVRGALGDGTTTERHIPVQVSTASGLTTVIAIAAGGEHSVFIKGNGTTWTCGGNVRGQLGDFSNTDRLTAVQVPFLNNVVAIAAGKYHSLFVMATGAAWGCGANTYGQLGAGHNADGNQPFQVATLSGIVGVAAGVEHSLFLKNDGTVYACGRSQVGQLGMGNNDSLNIAQLVGGVSGINRIAAGGWHSIFLKNDGTVKACGSNFEGQLGNNSGTTQTTPVSVTGLSNVIAIAGGNKHSLYLKTGCDIMGAGSNSDGQLPGSANATEPTPISLLNCSSVIIPVQVIKIVSGGAQHGLFLKADGTVWASGQNSLGQLGDGTTTDRVPAVQVTSLSNVTAVEAGAYHSMFLKNDGTVWASGFNSDGQLGDGTALSRSTPVQVTGLTGVTAVAAGAAHTLFLKSDGTVWACGDNMYGQLGDGTTSDRLNAAQISGLTGIVAIATGNNYSLFLKNNGTVWGCGDNSYGQLGDGSTTNRLTPVQMSGASNIVSISCGGLHSLLLKNDGTAWACGFNGSGQLGDNTTTSRSSLAQVMTVTGVTRIATGNEHSMFVKADATAWACGSNGSGELGDGLGTAHLTPVQVVGLSNINGVAATSGNFSLYVRNSCEVWGCGFNLYGQLGSASPFWTNPAQQTFTLCSSTITPLPVTQKIAAGSGFSLLLKNDGKVWSVGLNDEGQLGDGATTDRTTPAQVAGLSGITAVSAGNNFSLCLKNDGTVWAFGANTHGQLGDGTTTRRTTPIQIPGLNNVVAISAGKFHYSVFLKSDGTVWACGYNLNGELGDGTTVDRLTPVQVSGLTGIVAISAGQTHTMFLKNDGSVWTCGENGYGQRGDGISADMMTPAQIPGLTDVVAVQAAYFHTLFVKSDGTAWACGSNNSGALGTGVLSGGLPVSSAVPVQIGSLNGVTGISASFQYSAFLKNDGTVWVCGINTYGQIGDGTTTNRNVPVQVTGLSNINQISAGVSYGLFLEDECLVWAVGHNNVGQLANNNTADLSFAAQTFDLCNLCNVDVTSFAAPAATSPCLGGSSLVVIGSSTLVNGATYTANYTLSGASGNSGTYTSPPFVFGAGAGTFTVNPAYLGNTGTTTVTINYISEGSCNSAALTTDNTANFSVNALPAISAIGNNGPVCTGAELSLNASVSGAGVLGYSWTGPAGYSASIEDPTVTGNATLSEAGVYHLLITDDNECTAARTTTVVVTPPPPIGGSNVVAMENTITLSCATGDGVWSSGNTTVATVSASGVVTGVAVGTADISYVTAGGCISVKTVTVIIGGSQNSVCVGQQALLTDGGAPGGTWLSGNGSVATVSASGVVSGVGAGTVLIYYFPPASAIVTNTVTVRALSATNTPSTICERQTVTATNATPGGGLWSSSNSDAAVISDAGVITGTGAGTTIISYVTTTGCIAQKTLTVLPSPLIAGGAMVCAGQTVQLSAGMTGGTWHSSNASLATVSVAGVLTGVSAGMAPVMYILPSGCGDVVSVNVKALSPIVSVASVCQGQVISATNATPGGGVWSSDNTSVATITASGTITGAGGGLATISFTAVNGCVAQRALTVLPAPLISGPASVCAGQTIQMSSSMSGGNWQSSNASLATVSASGIVTGVASGSVVINYVTGTGCNGAATITVRALSPIVMPESICQGNTYTVAANATPGGGIWSSSNTDVVTIASDGLLTTGAAGESVISFVSTSGCITQNTLTVLSAPQVSGSTSVCIGQSVQLSFGAVGGGTWIAGNSRATVTAAGSVTGVSAGSVLILYSTPTCAGLLTMTVSALSPIVMPQSVCQGQITSATNSTAGGGLWSSSNTSVATITAMGTITPVAPGSSVISFTTSAGCTTEKTLTVLPTPQLSGATIVCVGQSIQLSSDIAGGGVWETINPGRATVSSSGLVTGVSAGNVVIGQTLGGCTAGRVITVNALSPSSVPSGICQGAAYYTATNATPGGGVWSSSNTAVATVMSDGLIMPGLAGITTISFVTTTGCITQNTLTIIPVPQLSGGTSVCVGQSVQLSSDMSGGTWASGNSRATASPGGLVTGVSAGPVAIVYNTATCANAVGFTVNALSPTTMSDKICQGSVTGATNPTPGGGVWSSSNSSVATISASGSISGVSGGTTVISFVAGAGCVTQKTLTVQATPQVSGGTSVCVGQNVQLSSTIISGGAWSSINPARATVSATGLVTGVAAGPVLVGYTIGTCSSAVSMTVNALSPITSAATVCPGQTIAATNATPGGGVWSSDNTAVARVNAGGVISGVSGGLATISFVTSAGCVATKAVSVSGGQPITGFPVVCQGQRTNLSNSTPGGNWSSSNGSLAAITSTGVVTGVAAGSPVIYYVLPTGCWTSVTMTVRPLSTTTGGTPSMCQSGGMTLANTTPGGGAWSSSNTSVATVSTTGFVRGQSAGTAIISFTTGLGCVQSRTVTVNPCREAQGEEGIASVTEAVSNAANLNLFPNPNQGVFTLSGDISVAGDEITAEVINMLGQVVYRGTVKVERGAIDHKFSLDMIAANGNYMLRLSAEGFSRVMRFTVNR